MAGRNFRLVSAVCWTLAFTLGAAGAQRAEVPKPESEVIQVSDDDAVGVLLDGPVNMADPVPVPDGVPEYHVVVGPDGVVSSTDGGVATGGALVYSNTLSRFVFGPQGVTATSRIADDITTIGTPGCTLQKYTVKVTGDRLFDGSGANQPFTVKLRLHKSCPGAGGDIIAGTALDHTVPAEQAAGITTIDFLPSPLLPVVLPQSLYLSVQFDRDLCGVQVGAPASVGFSADRLDFPGSACNAGLGGFPASPHASFYAQIFTNEKCEVSTLAYKATNHAGSAFTAGTNVYFAQNITLGVPTCRLKGWEITHKGNGIIQADLRTQLSNADPANGFLIGGTRGNCFSFGSSAQVCRFNPLTPVDIPQNLFMVFRTNSTVGGPILTCRQAVFGSTPNLILSYSGTPPSGGWIGIPGSEACWRALDIALFCEGLPPLGACCDMVIRDTAGEAVCRDQIPEMNCAFPEQWVANKRCMPVCNAGPNKDLPCAKDDCPGGTCVAGFCQGGIRNGLACTQDDCPSGSCLGSFCVGGSANGQACTREADCPGGACTGTPFIAGRGCGLAACCTPHDATVDACINSTRNECFAIEPVENARLFQRGAFCQEDGYTCPNPVCLERSGECTVPHSPLCVGGLHPGMVCDIFDQTQPCQVGFCTEDPTRPCTQNTTCRGQCEGGPAPGAPCTNNGDCEDQTKPIENGTCINFAGLCRRGFCVGGPNDGQLCLADDCPAGTCQETSPDSGILRCAGGTRNGLLCSQFPDPCPTGSCDRGECVGQGGCEDAFCCTLICAINPFCCETHWDDDCAADAFRLCEVIPANDRCYSERPNEGARLISVPNTVESDGVRATDDSTDPGFCCHVDQPGAKGVGSVWYKFVATDTSVRLSTCCTTSVTINNVTYPGTDSLVEVFAVSNPDRGRCADLSICSIAAQDCADDSECEIDDEFACQNLIPIGCSDDASNCSCLGFLEPQRSLTCVKGLIPGDTYYVMVAGKSQNHRGKYQLVISSPCSGENPLPNDFCNNAEAIVDQGDPNNYPLLVPFDLSGDTTATAGATFDCPGPFCTNDALVGTMTHDAWYDWTVPCTGSAIIETCAGDLTPDTGMVVYEGCECPVNIAGELACSFFVGPPCFLGSRVAPLDVAEGQCYKIRLSGNFETQPEGDISISLTCIPDVVCATGPVTFIDPPSGIVDARQPFAPNTPGTLQGIRSFKVSGPLPGVDNLDCWSMCETAPQGGANSITGIVDNGDGTYTVNLNRAITTNAVTTLTYTPGSGSASRGEFTFHPANVNGDSASAPSDIIFLIDILNGVQVPPHGLLSSDIDRSGVAGPPDILRVIDLLNAAAGYPNQLNRTKPACGVCCP